MRDAEAVTFGGGDRLDRGTELRPRADALAARADARVLPFWRGKACLVLGEPASVAWLPFGHPLVARHGATRVFLGLSEGGAPRFAVDLAGWEPADADAEAMARFSDASLNRDPALGPGLAFAELRSQMALLEPSAASVAATARGVLGWHATHGFCARCGQPSAADEGGWRRTCPACGGQHFPRTDPVVIMLVTRGERVLLGRQPGWPEAMYSLLAGFMEPGETIEAAVRREVWEEAGIRVGAVRYLASQPWPFPSSLMIGCAGEALDAAIRRDPAELEDARWASREEVLAGMTGRDPAFRPARRGAIARFLLERWIADALA